MHTDFARQTALVWIFHSQCYQTLQSRCFSTGDFQKEHPPLNSSYLETFSLSSTFFKIFSREHANLDRKTLEHHHFKLQTLQKAHRTTVSLRTTPSLLLSTSTKHPPKKCPCPTPNNNNLCLQAQVVLPATSGSQLDLERQKTKRRRSFHTKAK